MRRWLLGFCFFLLGVISVSSQTRADLLLHEGIALHDKGRYEEAIQAYKKAVDIRPQSMQIHYEMAVTYLALKKYEEVIKSCEKALRSDDELQNKMLIYSLMGSAYDNQGKSQKAIEVYDLALKDAGEDYLLHFNKGVTYTKMGNKAEAEKSYIRALALNITHPSSNLAMGDLLTSEGKTASAFFNYCFFLLLEPDTKRSRDVLKTIVGEDAVADAAYIKLYEMLGALYEGKSTLDLSTVPNIYKSFYLPFFKSMIAEGHLEAYCRKVSVSMDKTSAGWLSRNEDKVNNLHSWVTYNLKNYSSMN